MAAPPGLVEHLLRELRAPVDGVLALSNFIKTERLPPATLAHVEAIAEAGRSMIWLLEAAAELNSADERSFAAPTGLRAIMDEVEARWAPRAEEVGLTLMVAYDGDPESRGEIDARRLNQVFDGLLDHAMRIGGRGVLEASLRTRATPDGKTISLEGRVRHGGSASRPQDARDALAALGTEKALAGGLGLALAKRAVGVLRGSLDADLAAGAGCALRFDIACPAAVAEAPLPKTGAPQAHILIVDDNATNRMVAEALCEMFDCSCESAVDGVQAVELATEARFDLILMDIKMPRMDGVEATRAIRRLPGQAGTVPIVALTANASPDDVQTYMSVGMQGVVEKPIKPDLLLNALNAALGDGSGSASAAA